MPHCRLALERVGVFPILDQYYEPLFQSEQLRNRGGRRRELPGLDMNVERQLALLRRFTFADELLQFPEDNAPSGGFFYRNGSFEAGDAEYLYGVIRHFKPMRVVEVGGGYSTLIIAAALSRNRLEPGRERARHICIEPYENPWLSAVGVELLRATVESVDKGVFTELQANDVLFVDSSHVIRPGGDVLFECLELLPILKPGVLVHFHDVFTPREYTQSTFDDMRFWNEQYLLEAFLSLNRDYEVIGAVNFLAHEFWDELAAACPVFAKESGRREPGSFWLRRIMAAN
jgi:predicted O-methyltransferase YrrM